MSLLNLPHEDISWIVKRVKTTKISGCCEARLVY